MLKRLNFLIAIIIAVAAALYVVLLNRESVTVRFSPSNSLTSSGGVIFLLIFFGGVIFAALAAAVWGIGAYFREKRLHNRERQHQLMLRSFIEARNYWAAGEWLKAHEAWRQIVRRFPENILAHIELARSLKDSGELQEALKVLDAARLKDPQNIELLFLAAELNTALGNRTAAIDNLALILSHHPVKKAALMARDLCEELGRLDDALEYQARLVELGGLTPEAQETLTRLEFKKLLRDLGRDQEALLTELRAFVRKNGSFVPALQELAQLEKQAGAPENAVKLLLRAAALGNDPSIERQAIQMWLEDQKPEQALAAARSAIKDVKGDKRLLAELELIGLYLELRMLEEAKTALNNIPQLVKREGLELSKEVRQRLLVLKGHCLTLLGEYNELNEIWKKLQAGSTEDLNIATSLSPERPNAAPPPWLSTP